MIELTAPATSAVSAPRAEPDRLDHVISGMAGGDRAAFRCLYAFMAMRVWHMATEAGVCGAGGAPVTPAAVVGGGGLAGGAGPLDARGPGGKGAPGRVARPPPLLQGDRR